MLWPLPKLLISLLKDSLSSPVLQALAKLLYVVHISLYVLKELHPVTLTRFVSFLLSIISRDTNTNQRSLSSYPPPHTQVPNPNGLSLHFTNTHWLGLGGPGLMDTTLPGRLFVRKDGASDE